MIERRKLSDALLVALETANLTVGLATRPGTGGWQGTPNETGTNFKPFCVLTPESATRSSGPLKDSKSEWQLPYNLGCYGVSPDQAEWVADKARAALDALRGTNVDLGDATYRIQQVYPSTIGAIRRNDTTDPPHWGQNDLYTVWLSKEL
jgi:hypothetical protein